MFRETQTNFLSQQRWENGTRFQLYRFFLCFLDLLKPVEVHQCCRTRVRGRGQRKRRCHGGCLGKICHKRHHWWRSNYWKKKNPSSSAPSHYLSFPRAISSLWGVSCSSARQVKLSIPYLLPSPAFSCMRVSVCACRRPAGLMVRGGEWGINPSPASAAS